MREMASPIMERYRDGAGGDSRDVRAISVVENRIYRI
jgi:hypothetical protein